MNLPPTEFIRVRPELLREFSQSCFAKVGMNVEHASTLASLLVTNDLRRMESRHALSGAALHTTLSEGRTQPQPCREDNPRITDDIDGRW